MKTKARLAWGRAALVAAPVILATAAIGSGLGPSAWDAMLRLGDDSGLGAVDKVQRLLGLAREVTLNRQLDPRAQEIWDEVRDNLTALDVEELYEMLEDRGTAPDRRRELWFQGRVLAGGGYQLAAPARAREPQRFGDARGRLTLRPSRPADAEDGDDNYVVGWHARARLDDVRIEHVTGWAAETLRFYGGHAALHGASARESLDAADTGALAALRRAFPATYTFAARYLDMRDVVAPAAAGGSKLRIRTRLDLEPFSRDYPELGELLEGARGIMDARFRYIDRKGRSLATFELDSKVGEIGFDAHTLDGHIVPVGRDGRAVLDAAINLETVTSQDFALVVDTHTTIAGVWSRLSDLRFDVAYRRNNNTGGWNIALTETPKFRAGGAALGVVPLWMLDAMIPSDLEGITNSFFYALAKGNNGRGMWARFLFPASSQGRDLQAELEGELLSNGFVSFFLRIAAWKIIPDDEARAEMAILQKGFFAAMQRDLDAAKRRIRAEQVAAAALESRERLRVPMR